MPTPELRIVVTRGDIPEAEHRVLAAVVHRDGRLLASSGDPDHVTWWRSAAKPFQALPVVQEGAADRFAMTEEEIALACASHSSEPPHLAVVSAFMDRLGITDDALACGSHPPLSPEIAREVTRAGTPLTPRWSNCSGKHTAMIALALHRGWPVAGYEKTGHPVQQRILHEIAEWTGLAPERIAQAPDGCTAVCFGLPLRAMALGYARLAGASDPAAARVVGAMLHHPFLIAGTGRLCTDLMQAWPGQVIAKVGALGIYCAAIPGLELGVALKVEDGDGWASGVTLLEIIRQILDRIPPRAGFGGPVWSVLSRHAAPEVRNSRGTVTGNSHPTGGLRFYDG